MFLGEFLVLLDKCVDSVNHLLNELHLRVAESVLVGDVVSDACDKVRMSNKPDR